MGRRIILPDDRRSELFQGLGRAQSAGLDAVRTLDALKGICDGALDTPLGLARNAVRAGRPLTASLQGQGLLTELDRVLLGSAEDSGNIGPVCLRLAERYQRAWVRWRQMKGRLLMPGAVLVAGVLILPLPALASGALSLPGYVLRVGAMLALVLVLARLASATVREWRACGSPGWLTRVARLLPITGALSHLHQRTDVCERLALALQCGMPVTQALEAMQRAEGNAVRRAALSDTRSRIAGGVPLAAALRQAGLLDAAGVAALSAGEAAGRTDATLARLADAGHDALDGRYEVLARWIPVFVYFAVAGFVAAGLLG